MNHLKKSHSLLGEKESLFTGRIIQDTNTLHHKNSVFAPSIQYVQ